MARHFDSYIRNDVRCALPGYITSKNAAALVGMSKHGAVLKLKKQGVRMYMLTTPTCKVSDLEDIRPLCGKKKQH